jgi:hypothetical protein
MSVIARAYHVGVKEHRLPSPAKLRPYSAPRVLVVLVVE